MENEYDFSKGIKRKFYMPKEEINIPLYLEKENQDFYLRLAEQSGKSLSETVNSILSKDKEELQKTL
ncbi:MAG: hypothetical protein MH321_14180 [Leptospiraceae bacterium]|nr:hypothetical protein [Leptospiraceae bacterium]